MLAALQDMRLPRAAYISDEIHRLGVAERLDMARIMRRRMIGMDHMRLIEAVDQQAAFVIDR